LIDQLRSSNAVKGGAIGWCAGGGFKEGCDGRRRKHCFAEFITGSSHWCTAGAISETDGIGKAEELEKDLKNAKIERARRRYLKITFDQDYVFR